MDTFEEQVISCAGDKSRVGSRGDSESQLVLMCLSKLSDSLCLGLALWPWGHAFAALDCGTLMVVIT